MKKIVSVILVFSFLIMMLGCGDSKIIDFPVTTKKGVVFRAAEIGTYGLLNEAENRNPQVKYRLIIGNIVWAAILVETIIAPIYFLGFSLYEPVGLKTPAEIKGEV